MLCLFRGRRGIGQAVVVRCRAVRSRVLSWVGRREVSACVHMGSTLAGNYSMTSCLLNGRKW